MQHKDIVEYYDNCEEHYKILWNLDQSLAMHAGYWDETTQNLHDALLRENAVLADIVKIKSSDHVLDAGCGVGGSAIYLAKKYGCKVTGITLSSKQVETAKKNAQKCLNVRFPDFFVEDFTKTSFPDESFDVVWGIESVCHAERKKDFIQEAYRLLKKGGRLIIADAFNLKDNYSEYEQFLMDKWLHGWLVDSIEKQGQFHDDLKTTGFRQVTFKDITPHVIPSSRRLFAYSFPAFVVVKIAEWLHLRTSIHTRNIVSAYYQYKALRRNLWTYGIFYCEKPE